MKILICGATGFVGRHLTTSLRAAGQPLFAAFVSPRYRTTLPSISAKTPRKKPGYPNLPESTR